ncbi:MAG: hypothetical protein JST12_16930 [Armatimonadetes bacterium]|nr:hypothetical protein [Armatimonadota bacterium]
MHPKKFALWFLLAWVVASIPLVMLHGVPGVDTPNHVARLHVLASLEENHSLWLFYRVHWALLPNLAVDLFVTPMVYLFNLSALTLMKIFLINMVGVTGLGFAILNRALTGKWSAYGLFGLLFAYSYVLGFGFINYLFGIGLALLFVGVQLWLKDFPKWRGAVVAIGFPILLLNHLLALVLGAMTLLAIAWWQRDRSKGLWVGFAIGSVLSLVYMKMCTTAPVTAGFRYDRLGQHLRNVFFPLYFSDLVRDLVFWVVVVGVALWLMRRSGKKHSLGLALLGGFLALGLVLPHMAMTSAFLSGRISIWAILVGGAALEEVTIAPLVVLGLLGVRTVDLCQRFVGWNTTFDQLQADLRVIPDKSLVYQMVSMRANPLDPAGWSPSLIHADCLLLLKESCYINNLFSMPYQQPLENAPEIGPDLRDLYNFGTPKTIERSRQWMLWQLGLMAPTLHHRPVYIYFIKSAQETPSPILGTVLVDRPRYVIYRYK